MTMEDLRMQAVKEICYEVSQTHTRDISVFWLVSEGQINIFERFLIDAPISVHSGAKN